MFYKFYFLISGRRKGGAAGEHSGGRRGFVAEEYLRRQNFAKGGYGLRKLAAAQTVLRPYPTQNPAA